MDFDLARTSIATLLSGLWDPLQRHKLLPPDRACRAHIEPIRRLPPREPSGDRRYYPVPKIYR